MRKFLGELAILGALTYGAQTVVAQAPPPQNNTESITAKQAAKGAEDHPLPTKTNTTKPTHEIDLTTSLRYGIGPGGKGYKYAEVYGTTREGWIPFDVGVINFEPTKFGADYNELFAGGGKVLLANDKGVVVAELFINKPFGSAAKGEIYLQPFVVGKAFLPGKITLAGKYLPYIPLNEKGASQHVLENAKVEKQISKRWSVETGFAGYKADGSKWDSRPFVGATLNTKKLGSIELRFQKWNGGWIVNTQLNITNKLKW